jgi:hypothetical protein
MSLNLVLLFVALVIMIENDYNLIHKFPFFFVVNKNCLVLAILLT